MAKLSSRTADARATMETAGARVKELEAKMAAVVTEYQQTRLRLTSATAAEIDQLSSRKTELERLHGDVNVALESARRDHETAAHAFGTARLGEAALERDQAFRDLVEQLRPLAATARSTARRAAELEGEIRGLRLPVNTSRPIDATLQTEEAALLAAWSRAVVGGDGATVEVRLVRDVLYQNPPAGLLRRHYASGMVLRVPIGTAFVLEGEGVAERVSAA